MSPPSVSRVHDAVPGPGSFGVAEIFVLATAAIRAGSSCPGGWPTVPTRRPRPSSTVPSRQQVNALGMGVAPSMSVFTISVVGLRAGFSMLVGAIGTLTKVGAAAFFGHAGARLVGAHAAQLVRDRAAAMALPLLAGLGTMPRPFS